MRLDKDYDAFGDSNPNCIYFHMFPSNRCWVSGAKHLGYKLERSRLSRVEYNKL